MQYRRPENSNSYFEPDTDARERGRFGERARAVRDFLTRRRRRAATGAPGEGGRAPSPAAQTAASPFYLAAPPAPSSGYLDTRLAREVRRLLRALGTSRGMVASALEGAAVRAVPGARECSPIALYMSAIVGSDPNVKSVVVTDDAVVVELRAWWRPTVSVALPPAVHDFLPAFDAGCYPSLIVGKFRESTPRGEGDLED